MDCKVKVRQRGNCYFLDWRAEGKRHRRSLGAVSKAEADREAIRLKATLLTDQNFSGLVPSLNDYFHTSYGPWSRRYHPASWERKQGIFEVHLLDAFGATRLDSISLSQVERWIDRRLNQGAAPATVERELRALLACLRHAAKREVIRRIPCAGARVPMPPSDPSPHWFDSEDLKAIYRSENDPHWRAVWKLVANTGMRRGEAKALTWDDVEDTGILIRSIDDTRRTKSGKSRRVPLSPGAQDALTVLREIPGSKVLPEITPHALSRRFRRVADRAGVGGHFHSLRHTFVTHLLNAGNPLHLVKELAGHADIHTTMRYAHTSPKQASAALSRLSL